MDSKAFFDEHLENASSAGIFRGFDATTTIELCEKAWEAGVQLVEIPIQSPDAIATLRGVIDAGPVVAAWWVPDLSPPRRL